MRILSGKRKSPTQKRTNRSPVAQCGTMRDHYAVPTRKLSTTNFSPEARERLADAVAAARIADGHLYRTTFARAAGIRSLRSLELLEAGDPGVGQAILIKVAQALPNWTEDTPKTILEGGPIPPTFVEPPAPTDINEEMLESLHLLTAQLVSTPVEVISHEEASEFVERMMRNWERAEPGRGRYLRTLERFRKEDAQRHSPTTERKSHTPNE